MIAKTTASLCIVSPDLPPKNPWKHGNSPDFHEENSLSDIRHALRYIFSPECYSAIYIKCFFAICKCGFPGLFLLKHFSWEGFPPSPYKNYMGSCWSFIPSMIISTCKRCSLILRNLGLDLHLSLVALLRQGLLIYVVCPFHYSFLAVLPGSIYFYLVYFFHLLISHILPSMVE